MRNCQEVYFNDIINDFAIMKACNAVIMLIILMLTQRKAFAKI